MVTRMPLKATTAEELAKMGGYALEAADMLASADVDVICYGCTVETILQGLEYDRTVEKRLSAATGRPARTMTGAVMEAFRALGTRKLALVTPYIDEINEHELTFMRSIGLEVVYMKGLRHFGYGTDCEDRACSGLRTRKGSPLKSTGG